jgi:hypothetical protein
MQIEIHGRPLSAGSGIKQMTKNNISKPGYIYI